ncbi:hypothetical protein V497_05731 [Pseudogymnoascus sp. VKM F-4516 (FW-969)]|nr:hypothetical protein V497_05731 [Pseudogymnoascus sp. VKM F-4516 (FW-969)]
MGQAGNSPQSGDQQPINDVAATATAHGDSVNSLRGNQINPTSPPNSQPVEQPGPALSAAQILPVTATSVSESIDVVDAPNVASPTTQSRPPVESHETILQGGEPTDLANPAFIIRTSAPAPGSMPASDANGLPIDQSTPPGFTFPTRSNTEFIASFPQTSTNSSSMLFTHGAGAAHRRRSMANTSAITEYEADLTSKDRLKQKEAVRNILASKIRNDWTFPNVVDDAELEPSEALPEGDPEQPTTWIERGDWLSELSDSSDSDNGLAQTSTNSTSGAEKPAKKTKKKINPFRFDSPDGVGEALRRSADRRKLRRQRKLQEELAYNEGLRCFTARRNAWTNARIVRRPRCAAASPTSPNGEKPPAGTDDEEAILDTLLPIAPPLLPPSTPMRRNITSRAHSTIYDKVVMQSQTPMCPINLQTVVSSCVDGWKRDGEWPPRGTEPEATLARRRNVEAAGAAQKGVWRRSLQKVFGRAGTEIV